MAAKAALAATGRFDVVVVHTLDRWARNLHLAGHNVGLVSITENIRYVHFVLALGIELGG